MATGWAERERVQGGGRQASLIRCGGSLGRYGQVHLPDSNPRAFVYVSGRTPNRWGFMEGGKHLADHLAQLAPDVRDGGRAAEGVDRQTDSVDGMEG